MAEKPKVAIYWLTACGGCDEAIVDLNEAILTVADAVDIVLWPVAMDFKYASIRKMKKGDIALTILHGAVRNSEQEEMAKLLREKSQLVLAFGACACFGGTPGLANFRSKEDIFNWVYQDAPTVVNPKRHRPQPEVSMNGDKLTLPEFFERVHPLNHVIDIDYYLPGCPPPPQLIANAVFAVLEGKLPPRGATLAPAKPLKSRNSSGFIRWRPRRISAFWPRASFASVPQRVRAAAKPASEPTFPAADASDPWKVWMMWVQNSFRRWRPSSTRKMKKKPKKLSTGLLIWRDTATASAFPLSHGYPTARRSKICPEKSQLIPSPDWKATAR